MIDRAVVGVNPVEEGKIQSLETEALGMAERIVWHCLEGTSRKFYSLSVERDLWGNRAIVRRWGRLDGTRTGCVVHWDPDLSFAEVAREVHQRRRWHRYELVWDEDRVLGKG